MGQFDSFYEGSMSPPLTVDGRLIPTPTTLSPAQIYAGIYPSNPMPQMSSIGPGPGPSGGYSFLQDMIDANSQSQPAQVARSTGLPPSLYGGMQGYQDSPSMIARNRDPGGGYSDPLTAINNITINGSSVPLPRARPLPTVPQPFNPWGPSWGIGINPDLMWSDSAPGAAPEGDAWQTDRFGEPVAPRPGYATGNRALPKAAQNTQNGLLGLLFGSGGPSASPTPSNNRPITYSAPVAAGNFAEGSPNQSFEEQNGMGSVTNSMASSSRWNTGY